MATKSAKTTKKSSSVKTETPAPTKNESIGIRKTKHDKPALVIILAIILFFLFLYLFKGLFVAASVNGQPISRFAVVSILEKQGGQQTLDNLVTKALVRQEAEKRKIVISQADIDKEIASISKNLKAQGTSLDQALEAQGMTRTQLNDEITLQLMIQKMVGQNIKISDKEVNDFLTQNASSFPEGASESAMRAQALAQLKQQKTQLETQKFLKSLQDNAKTIYFIKY